MLKGSLGLLAMLRLRRFALFLSLPGLLTGCFSGLAGVAAAFVVVADGGDSGDLDAPPTVEFDDIPAPASIDGGGVTRQRMTAQFKLRNEDAGRLAARVEFVLEPAGAEARPATPAAGSDSLDDVPNGSLVTFVWDVTADLGPRVSRFARFLVTPIEDGVEGSPVRSAPFRAGNTPLEVADVELSSSADVIFVNFRLIDEESDPVTAVDESFEVKIAFREGDGEFSSFHVVPLLLGLPARRPDFPSQAEGADGRFSFSVIGLSGELEDLGGAGFVGDVRAQVRARDFRDEGFSEAETSESFRFDNNDRPTVEIVSVGLTEPANGVVAIRYRILDSDENPATVIVRYDIGDGEELAHELAIPPSEGTTGLCSLDPDDRADVQVCADGDPAEHVFLWDAVGQLGRRSLDNVKLLVRARDRDVEEGPPASREGPLDLTFLDRRTLPVGDEPRALEVADFDGDGYVDLVVANAQSGSLSYLSGGPLGLRHESDPDVGALPVALASGDFDGDGTRELVVGHADVTTISYFRRGPEGPKVDIELGQDPAAFVTGNFVGERFLDLVVAGRESVYYLGYLRDGEEGFKVVKVVKVVQVDGAGIVALAAGDLDGDGRDDVVVGVLVRCEPPLSRLSLLRGGADGPLLPRDGEPPPSVEFRDQLEDLVTGDFDGDGRLDLAVSMRVPDCAVSSVGRVVFLRNGVDAFREIEVGEGASALVAGDFDSDGTLDVVVANRDASSVSYLRGGADGPEIPDENARIAVGVRPAALISGDFDGDGGLDIIVANAGFRPVEGDTDSLSYLRGGPTGLQSAGEIAVGDLPGVLAAADFDGEGSLDLVVANGHSNDLTYLNGASGGLLQGEEIGTGEPNFSYALVSGDFDGDGRMDVVATNEESNTVSYLRGAAGGLSRPIDVEVGDRPAALVSGDFDGDGSLDVVVAKNTSPGFVTFLRGGPEGLARAGNDRAVGSAPGELIAGDFDGDRELDVVVLNRDSNTVSYLRGGPGGLGKSAEIEVGWFPTAAVAGRFDADERLDVVVVNRMSDTVTYLRGGTDGLRNVREIPVGPTPVAIAAGDFDSDGSLDVVVANRGSPNNPGETVSYVRGGPGGLLSPDRGIEVREIDVGIRPAALVVGDFDGDGSLDVAVANSGPDDDDVAGSVTYLRGGPCGLQNAGEISVGQQPTRLLAGDFDGDGGLDVLVTNEFSRTLSHLRGGPAGLGNATEMLVGSVLTGGEQASGLVAGDFDGNGSLDVVVRRRSSIRLFHQKFLLPHASAIYDPELGPPASLDDPRSPARYRLELLEGAFAGRTHVSVLPVPAFSLPQGVGFPANNNNILVNVTDTVAVLREDTRIHSAESAFLTLRLRSDGWLLIPDPDLSRLLRVYRANPATGAGEREVGFEDIDIVDLGTGDAAGTAVRFPIDRFGRYVVTLELDRSFLGPCPRRRP